MKSILIPLVVLIVLALVPVLIIKKKRAAFERSQLGAMQDAGKADDAGQADEVAVSESPDLDVSVADVNENPDVLDKLLNKFNKVFIEEQAYLDPNMTMEEMASRIGTNRTYISRIVNMKYGVSFREYLNTLRIEHAKKLLMSEPNSSMVSISGRCGFYGANQFIRKFREMEGVTPTVWRASRRV